MCCSAQFCGRGFGVVRFEIFMPYDDHYTQDKFPIRWSGFAQYQYAAWNRFCRIFGENGNC